MLDVWVAPYVGAWIETASITSSSGSGAASLPTWERGLKLRLYQPCALQFSVAPYVGAWIETVLSIVDNVQDESLPTWERGLKLTGFMNAINGNLSLPTWERGLKQTDLSSGNYTAGSRSLRGSVD